MICPLKIINPQKHGVLSCEERCALRLVMPYEDYHTEEGKAIEYCGLIHTDTMGIVLKNACFIDVKEE